MLYLTGIGLQPKHLTLEAIEALKACEKVYLEGYTSAYSTGGRDALEDIIGKAVSVLSRKQVEGEFLPVLEGAMQKNVALCVFGNPLNATTHVQVVLDAKKLGVKTIIIPGISVFEFAAFTGLERYKFGKTTSIVFQEDDYAPESFYDTILENKKMGLHTLCLLDIRADEEKMMAVRHAVSILESIEEKREKNVVSESILIGMAGMGSASQQVKAGTTEQLKARNFSSSPQSLIVCGKLNEKEMEGLKALAELE